MFLRAHHLISITNYQSIFINPNHYAYYLTIVILLSATLLAFEITNFWKIIYFSSFSLNTIILVLNNTFGCYIACMFSFIALIFITAKYKKTIQKKAIILFLMFLLISTLTSFLSGKGLMNVYRLLLDIFNIANGNPNASKAGSSRWLIWKTTIKFMNNNPKSWIFGFGLEGYARELYKITKNTRVHNEFLEVLSFFGIPTLAAYVLWIRSVFSSFFHNSTLNPISFACMIAAIGYLISSLFGVSMFYTRPYFFICAGIMNIKFNRLDNYNENLE